MDEAENEIASDKRLEPELSDSGLTKFGGALSALYLFGFGIFAFFQTDWPENLKPNELGDFLAGAFAPLAFLWLILGFLQQGRELRNSAKALHLQVGELRASVSQSRMMVEVTRDQLQLDRELQTKADQEKKQQIQPLLRNRSNGSSKSSGFYTFKFILMNAGNECFDLEGRLVLDELSDETAFPTMPHFPKSDEMQWNI